MKKLKKHKINNTDFEQSQNKSKEPGNDYIIINNAYLLNNKETEMDKILTNELKDALKQHEGIKEHPYLDSVGFLTIGIGNNISKLENFMALNLVDIKDGHTLNSTEKENLYAQIISDIQTGKFAEANYSRYNVPATEIENEFNHQLEQSYHELEMKFPYFHTFPITVQQALVDMQFNMGNVAFQATPHVVGKRKYSGWPKLFDAINNRDWQTAATHSHRKDVQPSRNTWTRDLFLRALI